MGSDDMLKECECVCVHTHKETHARTFEPLKIRKSSILVSVIKHFCCVLLKFY